MSLEKQTLRYSVWIGFNLKMNLMIPDIYGIYPMLYFQILFKYKWLFKMP